MFSISRPTLPVAPTTATLKPIVYAPKKFAGGSLRLSIAAQRIYANIGLNTILAPQPGGLVHQARSSFTRELGRTLLGLGAYVGLLAAIVYVAPPLMKAGIDGALALALDEADDMRPSLAPIAAPPEKLWHPSLQPKLRGAAAD
jgi:hypothetical protein